MSDFKDKLKAMSDEELRTFVPDVYQKSIFNIDYPALKAKGVKCLCFDIDDTISASVPAIAGTKGVYRHKISGKKVTFFRKLKSMGVITVLITNSPHEHAERFGVALGCDLYIGSAKKPNVTAFQEVQDKFGLEKSQMAHVGNKIEKDIKAANDFGIISCLVRNKGWHEGAVLKVGRAFGKKTKGYRIRKELESRKLWRKSHKHEDDDQYYQLGETPPYIA
jgi:predicted HAD superfamily phosphohydrolase YqeG